MKRKKNAEERKIWKGIGGKRKYLFGGLCCLLAVLCLGICSRIAFHADNDEETSEIPELSGEVSKGNVVLLLDTYDEDGAYLVDYGSQKGDDWLKYYSEGEGLMDELDTVVHEEYHTYSEIGEDGERLYNGDGQSIEVAYTEVFPSQEMADSVPDVFRGARYMVYIAEGDQHLSNVKGAYGILNELGAYSWGMNNAIAMYPYYDRFEDDMDTWGNFISKAENGKLAYAEMKYYLLYYLRYAKKNHPEVYQKILVNEEFRLAYKGIDNRFAKRIADYEADLAEIETKLLQAGYEVEHTDNEFMTADGSGVQLFTDMYSIFFDELEKKPYMSIHRELIGETDED